MFILFFVCLDNIQCGDAASRDEQRRKDGTDCASHRWRSFRSGGLVYASALISTKRQLLVLYSISNLCSGLHVGQTGTGSFPQQLRYDVPGFKGCNTCTGIISRKAVL